jgi:hypothetical protein
MVLRSGFTTVAEARNSLNSRSAADSFFRQFHFPAALLDGCRYPLHLAAQGARRGDPLFQPIERPFEQGGRGFEPLRNFFLFHFHDLPFFGSADS